MFLSLIQQKLIYEQNNLLIPEWSRYLSNSKLFIDLFQSPAQNFGTDFCIQKLIKKELRDMKIKFMTDEHGNIFSLRNKNKPLLSAHMDTVQRLEHKVQKYTIDFDKDWNLIFKGTGIIGADDKIGIYIILEQLRKTPDLNFLFSVDEEVGCLGAKAFVANEENTKILETLPYALILDRRNGTDIVGYKNSYCQSDFDKALEDLKYGYVSSTGSISDANQLKKYLPCVNLSVGYYAPHTNLEYVNLSEMENCQDFVEEIVQVYSKRFKLYEYKPVTTTPSSSATAPTCYVCQRKFEWSKESKLQILLYNPITKIHNCNYVCPSCFKGHLQEPIDKLRLRKIRSLAS